MGTKTAGGKSTKPSERKSRFSTAVDEEALEFIKAIEEYKALKERPFPSWTEVIQVIKALGYRKVAESRPIADVTPE
ncbi:MAG: hypothetical protein CMJ83_13485 [Planctomycetes bacterium]|nr:hypothetical protein [Planctomycetota bacterium]